MVELIVSFTLLATLGTVLIPGFVRFGRTLQALRHERLAWDELSNQMEHLTTLPGRELPEAIESITVSPLVQQTLFEATLTAQATHQADDCLELQLEIRWNHPGRRDRPLRLVGWRFDQASLDAVPTTWPPDASPDTTSDARSDHEPDPDKERA